MAKDDRDTRVLTGHFSAARPDGEQAGAEISADVWREQGPWLVLFLLPLAALLFRRGYVLALALFLLPPVDPAYALDWDDLWLRQDQRGQRAMDALDYEAAAELFVDPAWKAAAQHRAGDYQAALDILEDLDGAASNYNMGNALARLGRYHEAIAAYDRSLAEQPDHADAKFNKELLEKELERQQQQQDQAGEQERQQSQDREQQRGGQQDPNLQEQERQQDKGQQQDPQQAGQEQQQDQSQSPRTGERQEQADLNEAPQPDKVEQPQRQQQQEPGEPAQEEDNRQQPAQTEDTRSAEEQQATEQWLRRIPDDPSGLLRRKFLYQYQQRNHERNRDEETW